MNTDIFDALILLARPGAGKSEIIRYLKEMPDDQRRQRFHVGKIVEIDDFPMLWAWFEEDALLERMGKPRLHSSADGYFLWQHLWDVLIERISLEYEKSLRDETAGITRLIEFSRGTEHGGYASAFAHLSEKILSRAAILYVDVSFAESLRKNRRRFNPNRPDSILEHGLPDSKLERLYAEEDWHRLSEDRPQGRLVIQGYAVPFVVFENEDDVTTPGGEPLGMRLQTALAALWQLYQPAA